MIREIIDVDGPFEIEIDEELNQLLLDMEKSGTQFDENKMDALMHTCKEVVIDSIMGPFGLSRAMFDDKHGGPVDTLNNVKVGVYATPEAEDSYKNREKYKSEEYHRGQVYVAKNRENSAKKKEGKLIDEYSGEKVGRNEKCDLDHVISAKEISDDPMRVLAELYGPDLANVDSNLKATSASVNRSKGAKSMEKFTADWENKRPERLKKIDDLSKKKSLTDKERKTLKKLKDQENFNPEIAQEIDEKARKEYESKIDNEYYTSKNFAKNTLKTSVSEGFKVGLRQSVGLLLNEVVNAVFWEIKDFIKNDHLRNAKWIDALRIRLQRVVKRVTEKWKDMLIAFKDGAVSGFISNLVTIIINIFVTTAKRVVTIIREGFLSLMMAIKIISSPPEGMTTDEAMFEGSKIISVAIMTCVGIAMEDTIEKYLTATIPLFAPMASEISLVVTGIITGISTALVVHALDAIKDNFQFTHQRIVHMNEKVLYNKCLGLQTVFALETTYQQTSQITEQINNDLATFNHGREDHKENMKRKLIIMREKLKNIKNDK